MKVLNALLAALLLCAPGVEAAQTQGAAETQPAYTLEDFLKQPRFRSAKLSPNGTYVAATVPLEDRTVLVILKPGQDKPYGYVNFRETNTHVIDFEWVNNERILFTLGERAGTLEQPVSFGEIWGTNADGTRQGVIVGARASRSANRAGGRARSERSSFFLIDSLRNDEDNVLVGTYPWDAGEAPFTSVERMNVHTGAKTTVIRAPARAASFLADPGGDVRFAHGENKAYDSVLYYREPGGEWQLINDESVSKVEVRPLDFSADGKVAYLRTTHGTGPDSILEFDVGTRKTKEVFRDDFVSPSNLVYAVGSDAPIGVAFFDGKVRYHYFVDDGPEARLHRALQSSFDGEVVSKVSATKDESVALLRSWSDRNPGEFFVFDAKAKKAERLLSVAEWIDPMKMATVKPFRFEARDGRQLEGFVTIPRGSEGKRLPLVVHPHGGPFGVADAWGFNQETQLLASQGYAVLQVNFRGSGGYGKEFERAGHKQWGLSMQDDLTDATHWAVREGIADGSRMCMYGASYGAYASLMAVAKEPALYKCAVGYVGVYDLKMMWNRGDIPQSYHGRDFLYEALGKDGLDESSPSKLAGRIKVPVFLTAGGEDVRTPQAQTEAMERALKAAAVPVESKYYPTEGHGYHSLENKRDYYTRLLGFLARYLGGEGAVPAPAPAGQ